MVGPGAARRQRVPQVERREAQRPTSLGACAPQAVTLGNQEWPWAHGWPDRKGCPKGAVAQRPGASRRSIPLVGKRKKGNRRSRRLDTTGDDAWLFDKRIGEGTSARQARFPSPLVGEGAERT